MVRTLESGLSEEGADLLGPPADMQAPSTSTPQGRSDNTHRKAAQLSTQQADNAVATPQKMGTTITLKNRRRLLSLAALFALACWLIYANDEDVVENEIDWANKSNEKKKKASLQKHYSNSTSANHSHSHNGLIHNNISWKHQHNNISGMSCQDGNEQLQTFLHNPQINCAVYIGTSYDDGLNKSYFGPCLSQMGGINKESGTPNRLRNICQWSCDYCNVVDTGEATECSIPYSSILHHVNSSDMWENVEERISMVQLGPSPSYQEGATTVWTNTAFCKVDADVHIVHFPHYMQHILRCWSYFQQVMQQSDKINRVILIPDKFYPKAVANPLSDFQRGINDFLVNGTAVTILNHTSVLLNDLHGRNNSYAIVAATGAGFWVKNTDHARQFREQVMSYLGLEGGVVHNNSKSTTTACAYPRIAIVNRKQTRRLINAQDLSKAIQRELGLKEAPPICHLDSYTFHDQVEFFSNTDIVISPHGAQLTGALFMSSPGAAMLEIFPLGYVIPWYLGSLSETTGLHHSYMYETLGNPEQESEFWFGTLARRNVARARDVCVPIPKVVQGVKELVETWKEEKCIKLRTDNNINNNINLESSQKKLNQQSSQKELKFTHADCHDNNTEFAARVLQNQNCSMFVDADSDTDLANKPPFGGPCYLPVGSDQDKVNGIPKQVRHICRKSCKMCDYVMKESNQEEDVVATGLDYSATTQQNTTGGNTSLVILLGNLRGGEKVWQSLYKNILDVNSADLALIIGEPDVASTANGQYTYPNSSLLSRAKKIWYFPEYDDWGDAVDLINGTEWRKTAFPHFRNQFGLFGGIKGLDYKNSTGTRVGSTALVFMVRWFLAKHLKEDHDILQQYERFVVTRSDQYYKCPHYFHALNLQHNTLWVPEGENYGGICDRYFVVSRNDIFSALDSFPTLLKYPQLCDGPKDRASAEWVLALTLRSKNINVKTFDRVMFTCATVNDTSRWSSRRGEVPGVPGLYLKYPNEYKLSNDTCNRMNFSKEP